MDIIERVFIFMGEVSINKSAFEKKVGLPNGYIGKIKKSPSPKKIEDILRVFPELNDQWLLYGKGEMLKNSSVKDVLTLNKVQSITPKSEYTLVPLYNFDAVAGMGSENGIIDCPEYIDDYIPFIDAHPNDICLPITGNSMAPTYTAGCIVLLREVHNWQEYFGYGDVFVIVLKNGRRIIKEVHKSSDDPKIYIHCVSHNSSYESEDLPRSLIYSVYKVIRVLTDIGY